MTAGECVPPLRNPPRAMLHATLKQLCDGLANGKFSSVEVTQYFINRIKRLNKSLNSFISVDADKSLTQARAADALRAAGKAQTLTGVPIAQKDIFCTQGWLTTCGSKMLSNFVSPYDAHVIERFNAAGAVNLGKTNMDEFAMGSSNETSYYGPVRNPWNRETVPGGSSGGSAAAVAARQAPAATGTDTGGSIRQPAALCGVVGVKPTYGRVSRYGLVAFASSLDQIGPFAATVADAAAAYDAIAGWDQLDSTSIRQPLDPTLATLGRGAAGLRVGLVREMTGSKMGIAADVLARVEQSAQALTAAGAEVEEVSVPAAVYGLSAYYLIAPAEASSNLARFDGVRFGLRVEGATTTDMQRATRTAGFGPEVKRRIMLGTYALSAGYYDAYYGKAQRVRRLILNDFNAAYGRFDVLLAPTSPTTAFALGAKTEDPMTMYLNDVCTIPSNLVGHPALSVPFGTGSDGLPVGVQLMGPALSESLLFQVAAVLEAARP